MIVVVLVVAVLAWANDEEDDVEPGSVCSYKSEKNVDESESDKINFVGVNDTKKMSVFLIAIKITLNKSQQYITRVMAKSC